MPSPPLILPFRGLRYNPSRLPDLSPVISPPYDIISPQEEALLLRRHPENVVRLELARPAPEDAGAAVYAAAAATLDSWLASRVLEEDPTPAFYPLEQTFSWRGRTHHQRGFLCLLRVTDWEDRLVLPHENTLPRPKAQRIELLRACQAHFSPILALYRDSARALAGLGLWEEPPLAQGELDGVRLRLWSLADRQRIGRLQRAVADGPLFIADGHHRYESALTFRHEMRLRCPAASPEAGFNYLLAHLLEASDPGVVILPAHRLLSGLNPTELRSAWRQFQHDFEFESLPCLAGGGLPARAAEVLESREERPVFGIYRGDGKLLLARPRPGSLPSGGGVTAALDVNLAHRLLVQPLLAGGEGSVSYASDDGEALEAVDRGECQLALLLRPTRVEQVLLAGEAGERMPGKSTYFYPKIPAGVVMARIASA